MKENSSDLINEERLRYIGSRVLGLNDALVELTGALADFALAFPEIHTLLPWQVSLPEWLPSLSMAASSIFRPNLKEGP